MKGNYLIHVLLLAILCVNQIAAQVHVAGHIDSNEHLHDHFHDHSSEQALHNLNPDDPSSDSAEIDCAGFHAYAGLNGLVSVNCIDTVAQLKGIVKPLIYNVTIVAQAADSLKIRGPPTRS